MCLGTLHEDPGGRRPVLNSVGGVAFTRGVRRGFKKALAAVVGEARNR